jgi:hypothetical protein
MEENKQSYLKSLPGVSHIINNENQYSALETGDCYADVEPTVTGTERRMSRVLWIIANFVVGVLAMIYGIVWVVMSGFMGDSGTRFATYASNCSALISACIVLGGLLHAVGLQFGTMILKGSIIMHIIFFVLLFGVSFFEQ